ncbi:MAG: hypothetical protein M1838_003904 [Thelocarpon superellum]|nr:MAG: hypothetical protein M1838_003904 [Thelocarpon superellum]
MRVSNLVGMRAVAYVMVMIVIMAPAAFAFPRLSKRVDPQVRCNGIVGRRYVTRDAAVKAARHFCNHKATAFEYNHGTEDGIRMKIENLNKVKDDLTKPSAIECVGIFVYHIIDGCDVDSVRNPAGYKYGGNYLTTNGWLFTAEPLHEHLIESSCDVSFHVFEDLFEIRGKNFPNELLGPEGEGLLKEVEYCGPVKRWQFEHTPDDVTFDWYAHGILPLWTRDCVGWALLSAGGLSRGRCRSSPEHAPLEAADNDGYD